MACSKYKLTNPSSELIFFNYRRCSDSSYQDQVPIKPGQSKNVWAINSSLISSSYFDVEVQDEGAFPPPPAPTPTQETPNETWIALAPNNLGTWTYSILDWKNETVIPNVLMDISNSDWYFNGFYELTNRGWALQFGSESNVRLFYFLDSFGTIIGSYSADTGSYSTNNLDGVWFTFQDYQNGVFKYFNGSYIGTLEYNTSYQSLDIDWDYFAVISTGAFSVSLYDDDSGLTTIKLLAPNVTTDIKTYNPSQYGVNVEKYFSGNFFVISTYDGGLGQYTTLEIYDSSGTTLLQNISLTGDTYNDWRIDFYGTNKVSVLFWNSGTDSVDWLINNYNGDTNVLIQTTLSKVTYPNYQSYYNEHFYPSNSPSENMFFAFYSGGSWNNSFYYTPQFRVLYFINGSTTFGSYDLTQGNPSRGFSYGNVATNNTFFIPVDTGNSQLTIASINSSGAVYSSTGRALSTITDGIWIDSFGDNYMFIGWTSCCNQGQVYVYGYNGQLRDTVILGGVGNLNYTTSYNTLFMTNNSDTSWYMNNQKVGFTSTSFVPTNTETQQQCYLPNFTYNGTIVAYKYDTYQMMILTPSSVTNVITYPTNNGRGYFLVGSQYFMYIYNNPLTNLISTKLYDFDGNNVNTINTSSIDDDCDDSVDKRFFYNVQLGEYHTWYMFSPKTSASVTMWTYNNWYKRANDYFY